MRLGRGGFLPLLVPLLIFLGALYLGLTSLRSESEAVSFADDTSYLQCVLAKQIHQGGLPGLSADQPSPMNRLSPYVYGLAATYGITGKMDTAVYLLGAFFGVLILFTMYQLSRVLELSPWAAGWALLLVVLNSHTLTAALSADGEGLFVLLISLGLLRYWKKNGEGDMGLSILSMLPIALAATLHIEAVVFLVWMVISAGSRQWLGDKDKVNAAAALIHLLNGVLLTIICLAPIVLYHMRAFKVPWPRYADATMLINEAGKVTTGAPEVSDGLWNIISQSGALMMPWPGILIFAGAAAGILLIGSRRQMALPIDGLSLLILPPALASLFSPITGPSAISLVSLATVPGLILLAVFQLQQVQIVAKERYGLPEIRWKQLCIPSVGGMALLTVLGLIGLLLSGQELMGRIQSLEHHRIAVIGALEQDSGVIASDEPGWLAWIQSEKVVDVNGHASISVLASMDSSGRISRDQWQTIIENEGIETWVIWSRSAASKLRDAGVVDLPANDLKPRVMRRGQPVAL